MIMDGTKWVGMVTGIVLLAVGLTTPPQIGAATDSNTIQPAGSTGLEVSQNSFARIINNTIQHSRRHGIYVLGSASAHIGVLYTNDKTPQPNVIQNNGGDGIQVLRASTARIIGNTLSGNGRNGLTVQQASH